LNKITLNHGAKNSNARVKAIINCDFYTHHKSKENPKPDDTKLPDHLGISVEYDRIAINFEKKYIPHNQEKEIEVFY
jgi:hypothetical protein